MRTELVYVFTGEEVVQKLGAMYIAESMQRSCWDTGRFRRLRADRLNGIDTDIVNAIEKRALYWYKHGIPKDYKCDTATYRAWTTLFMTCAEYDIQDMERGK